jgi:23S rRNA (cytidine1920-2'-O)/16S rRNA (cytidine1409-2'-O)-methyltransferase
LQRHNKVHKKQRLDTLLLERYAKYSRHYIQSLIMQGKVVVDGQVVHKAGALVDPLAKIDIVGEHKPRFVSRAGSKLEHALTFFNINVEGLVALDAGISTGGFTDCLLQHGVRKVYGVDVGYGQVHEKIRTDPRVILMERTNLRYLPILDQPIDLVTLDLSFISITKVLDVVTRLLRPQGILIALIKPQFEAGRELVGKGGIVKDPNVHQQVITHITHALIAHGFTIVGVTPSPIEGADGNKEFLAYARKN